MARFFFKPIGAVGLITLLFLFPLHTLYAIDSPSELLANVDQEKRAEKLGSQLRCLVCQNESIEDSNAELAKDLRHVIREHITMGESDPQIMQWMVKRYGTFIQLSPPFNLGTTLLWVMPFLSVIVGGGLCFYFYRKSHKNSLSLPLTPKEKDILAKIIQQDGSQE
ncbi:cytochrome c-type biogenesis protein [Entomobacter blattae]|uniref:cytochrome c-type biogenesis protein n=1 Tax=Entomobacter blattae TaxID=2762277 RepID=UPI001EF022E3|nr:cytochrome c-type biogenesis protein [Entomobacter blattae]